MPGKKHADQHSTILILLCVGVIKHSWVSIIAKLTSILVISAVLVFLCKECFNSPYGTQYFAKYAEKIPGECTNALSSLAKELQVFIVGGSIPEKDGEKYFNTCTVFSPAGDMVAKHRKV